MTISMVAVIRLFVVAITTAAIPVIILPDNTLMGLNLLTILLGPNHTATHIPHQAQQQPVLGTTLHVLFGLLIKGPCHLVLILLQYGLSSNNSVICSSPI